MVPLFRFAAPEDAPAVLSVLKSNRTRASLIHDRTPLPSLSQSKLKIREISREYPFLLCFYGETLLGYAYACPDVKGATIDRDVSFFVSTARPYTECKVAVSLTTALFALLRSQHVQRVFAQIKAPNPKAEQLLIHFGFGISSHFFSETCMCGQKHETLWFDKWIAPYDRQPPPVLPIGEVPQREVSKAFALGLRCLDLEELGDCFEAQ